MHFPQMSKYVRWILQFTVLLITFMAGKQLGTLSAAAALHAMVKPALSSPARLAPAAPAARPSERADKSGTMIPPAPRSSAPIATPASRLSNFINATSHFDEQQTLAALHQLDLQGNSVEARLQRHVLLGRYAEIDPETALTYVDTLSGPEHDDQIANVLGTWASHDPVAAASHFATTSLSGGVAGDEDRATAAAIGAEWAKNDPAAALKWSSTLPEEVRAEARDRILSSLAVSNPLLAAQTASALPAGYERTDAMQPVAAQWAQSSPAQAASWVQSLANPSEQASAASGLVATWMSNDPMAASQWVTQLRTGPVRDAAVAAMVQAQSLRNDPEAATLWAASVQDSTLREKLLGDATKQWQRQNPQAAISWQLINGP